MKQQPTDKYSIAWFKLAEFVARREKERALGLFRLLAHSFDDRALALQLEGDLLLSFDDKMAQKYYQNAAQQYQQDQRLIDAAAVYEHLLVLSPESEEYLSTIITLYTQLHIIPRLLVHIHQLSEILINKQKIVRLGHILNTIESNIDVTVLSPVYEQLVFLFIKHKAAQEYIHEYCKKAVDGFVAASPESNRRNEKQLNSFLKKLEAVDKKYYQFACEYVEKL